MPPSTQPHLSSTHSGHGGLWVLGWVLGWGRVGFRHTTARVVQAAGGSTAAGRAEAVITAQQVRAVHGSTQLQP